MIDDKLLTKAAGLTGVSEKAALLRQGLQMLVRVESAQRLVVLPDGSNGSTTIFDFAP